MFGGSRYAILAIMTTVTIPRQLAAKGDLVVIPRTEYDALTGTRVRLSPRLLALVRTGLASPDAGKLTKAKLTRLARQGMRRA